jgi:hypothetical protein
MPMKTDIDVRTLEFIIGFLFLSHHMARFHKPPGAALIKWDGREQQW